MNSDDCPNSQEYVSANISETYTIAHSNVTENCISSFSGENIILVNPTFEIEDGQQKDISAAAVECESYITSASKFQHENQFDISSTNNQQQTNVIFPSDTVAFTEEKQSLLSNINDSKDSELTGRINPSEIIHGEEIGSYNSVSSKIDVKDATIEESSHLLPETEQIHSAMEIEHDQQQPHFSDVNMDVRAGEYPPLLTSEHGYDNLAFIGPVLPLYSGLETQERTSFSDQDIPVPTSTCSQREYMSVADDRRYNLSVESVPRLVATAFSDLQGDCENFLRGCKWSPDGNCILTNSNDNCLRTYYPFESTITDEFGHNKKMVANVKMKECSQVYDFAWQPQANLSGSDFGRIACTCSGIPIHLWNASTGEIVANYRAYDQFDEITAAYSLAFSLDGKEIYAGYNKAIRIFNADYPVRACRTVKTYDSQRKEGQTGIISCFTFSPDGNGLYVAGSYSRHIGMYDSTCDKLVCLMQGQHGGITHLMFSKDATKLYSGGRKDAEILCWDIRNMDKILFSALRDVKTNQRMYFDLSQSGRYLVSGNNDGTVAFWDTLQPVEEINGDSFLKPCSQFQAHGDCVNGVSFNHSYNMIATASGQRHFHNFDDSDSSDSTDENNSVKVKTLDFSLRLWQIPLLI